MATPVELPKLGNTVEECIVSRWRKHKGEPVSAGEIIADVETDKATFELAAPVEGTLLELFFEEGALVPVFTNLCVIGKAGESVDRFRPNASASAPSERGEQRRDSPIAPDAPIAPIAPGTSVLSPRARRFAQEHDFHPASMTGSGPDGRVLEQDVRTEYYSARAASGEPGATSGAILTGDSGRPREQVSTRPERLSRLRDTIARRMKESLSTTAQYTLHASANAAGLLVVRAKIKATPGAPDININDLVLYCAIRAILAMPDINAEFVDGEIRRHADVNLGFACDTDRGLLVPVIRRSQTLSLRELSAKVKQLTAQATQGKIAPDDLTGGTFTVSNLGSLGIEAFTPVLNAPQVAILGVNSIQLKPVRRDGRVEFIDAIGLSLTCDHQVIDGAPGARFLKVVKDQIEDAERLCTI